MLRFAPKGIEIGEFGGKCIPPWGGKSRKCDYGFRDSGGGLEGPVEMARASFHNTVHEVQKTDFVKTKLHK
jgi:hypothetical protein